MPDDESSPLLAAKAKRTAVGHDDDSVSENTPLLSSSTATPRYDGDDDGDGDDVDGPAAEIVSIRSISSSVASPAKSPTPWPSIIAILILGALMVSIMIGAFFIPAAVEEYAKQAAVIEPTNLSIQNITADAVQARIQVNFRLDGSRVRDDTSRRIGRWATWLVRSLGTEATQVNVYLPDYDSALLGSANIPPLTISVIDGYTTALDIVAELSPGEAEGIRTIVNDWLAGKMDYIKLRGEADISLKTGVIPLGTHFISESLVFEANQVPEIPEFNISRLSVHDVAVPGQASKALGVNVSITAFNKYPVNLNVPELGFKVLVPNCQAFEPHIPVAEALMKAVAVEAHSDVTVDAEGIIKEIPTALTQACPDSTSSPLDHFLDQYLHGDPATVFVMGKLPKGSDMPEWVGELLSSITVPVPFPGRTFDNLIRSFSLSDVDFKLPNPMGDPDDTDADPKVSGKIEVLAAVPSELNFDVNVTHIRAIADVSYQDRKFGELVLREWQPANSTRIKATKTEPPLLKIRSSVKDAPLTITDGDIFAEIMQELLFGGATVELSIKADVDIMINTVLGNLVLNGVPATGKIPVKPLPRKGISSLDPQVGSVQILSTSVKSISLKALVNITNPTQYTAHIPYVNIHITKNGSIIGDATAQNLTITAGRNLNLPLFATWNPSEGGPAGPQIGRELISQYLSGYNTTIDATTHQDSFPSNPVLGNALSKVKITVKVPRLSLPGEPEERDRFIRDATFHVFSSTATFTLVSPLKNNTLYLEEVNATAFWNHTEPVGKITYDKPFSAPPGASQTPKLPVDWSVGSVGRDALRKAIGGELKLDARANVSMRVGIYRETLWYFGQGIGASIRI